MNSNDVQSYHKEGRPIDRYPHAALYVSDIAQQAYCEQQLDLWLANPGQLTSVPAGLEEVLPAAQDQLAVANFGSQFHEAVSQAAVPISWAEIEALLKQGQSLTLLETGLQGQYQGVEIVGKPDAISFQGWRAINLLEYKVTNSSQCYPNYQVQLLIYAYLLEQRGFDIDSLKLVSVLVPRRNREWLKDLSDEAAAQFVDQICAAVAKLPQRRAENGRPRYLPNLRLNREVTVTLWVFDYDPGAALQTLNNATAYWLGARAPIATTNRNKCQRCLYNAANLCDQASAPYKPAK